MPSYFSWFTQRSLTVKIAITIVALLVVGGIYKAVRPSTSADTSIAVTRGSISEVVSVTGALTPVQSVDLSFQGSGRVASAPAKVGDHVVPGQVLASLDTAELGAQLRNAQATVAAQQAKLNGLIAGSRPEDIAVAQAQLDSAQEDLRSAYNTAANALLDAYTKTDNAVRVQLGAMFTSVGTAQTPQYLVSFSCSNCTSTVTEASMLRAASEVSLNRWKTELDAIKLDASDGVIVQALTNARGYVQTAQSMATDVITLLSSSGTTLDNTTLQSYKTSANAASAGVVAALTAVNTQIQAIANDKLTVAQYTSQLALKKAGTTSNDLAAQAAAVGAAQAQADQIAAQISKNIIRSPIAGVVTKADAKVGQSAGANQTLVSVISTGQLEIDANIPEVDIGKLAVGDRVDFTVDALPGEAFTASVSFIDPAQTIVDGVVNFKLKAVISGNATDLKSGLTTNLDIQAQHKDKVLLLPQYAIVQNDQGTFVQKISGSTTVQTPVVLGIRSPDGNVEVISGVAEGDRVANIGLKKN